MPWGAAIAAGGAILGGVISSNGAKDAAGQQAGAARDATQAQLDMYNQTRTDNMPALGARNDALAQLQFELGVGSAGKDKAGYGALGGPINVGDVTADPGYGFGYQQGMQSLNNQFASRGMRDSGAAIKAASRFGTDYATTKYDDAFNRAVTNRNQQLNPFLSLAGAGQVGANQIGQAGQNYANEAGANARYAGDAAANGSLAQASIWGNTANQLAGWYGNQRGGGMNSGNSYWNSGNQYANWDLGGTNRGSGD